jgi:GntR family transcriptional regulator
VNTSHPPTLPFSHIDHQSPVPLYHQIYLDLRKMVEHGTLVPGDMLPTEVDICHAYHVGRQTVRQALARLVDEDQVERFAGRGTFVRKQPNHIQFFLDRSFSQQMREMDRMPHSRILNIQTGLIDAELVPALQPYRGSACLKLERLRLGDDEPICQQITTVLSEHCPGIDGYDFASKSLYEILATQYHLTINRIDHMVRAVGADGYRADLLEVSEGTPLLFVSTTTYLESNEVIEHSDSFYRADRYEYRTTQTCCNE